MVQIARPSIGILSNQIGDQIGRAPTGFVAGDLAPTGLLGPAAGFSGTAEEAFAGNPFFSPGEGSSLRELAQGESSGLLGRLFGGGLLGDAAATGAVGSTAGGLAQTFSENALGPEQIERARQRSRQQTEQEQEDGGAGFFERLTRSGSPGGLLDIIGRTAFGPPEEERLANEIRRQELSSVARQRQARSRFTSLLDDPETSQDELLSAAAQVAPDAVAKGLLAQEFGAERAEPSIVRIARTLNDPGVSDDVKSDIRDQLKSGGETEEQQRRLDLMASQIEFLNERAEFEKSQRDRKKNRISIKNNLQRDAKDAQQLAELATELEGSLLQTGVPLPEFRRAAQSGAAALGRAFGLDTEDAQSLVDKFDTFQKTASRFATQTAANFFDAGITNFQLESIQNQTPSLTLSPEANRQIIADQLEVLLVTAQTEGIDLNNADDIRKTIDILRSGEPPEEEKNRRLRFNPETGTLEPR